MKMSSTLPEIVSIGFWLVVPVESSAAILLVLSMDLLNRIIELFMAKATAPCCKTATDDDGT